MKIKTINSAMPFHLGSVNCYLIEHEQNFLLIDTCSDNQRMQLVGDLDIAGCNPGNLKMIILTHGDFDHVGNVAYLRQKYDTKIAMHQDDFGMIEHGDMFFSRKNKPNQLIRKMISIFSGLPKSNRFTPDLFLVDGENLTSYGFEVKVLTIPGHSPGSLAIMSSFGDVFCGDLFENIKSPKLNSLMDDLDAAKASLAKLKNAGAKMVYPGHGNPFTLDQVQS
jgi:hydroxyacylglutathione hydrolase